jgi:hypothetical protein
VGETPNLAARLQALAEPGTVVIGPQTRRLLGDLFECRDLGAVEVKGFPEPLHAYQVVRESAIESRFEALHGATLTPLVGREEEIDLLLRKKPLSAQLVSFAPGVTSERISVLRRSLAVGQSVCISLAASIDGTNRRGKLKMLRSVASDVIPCRLRPNEDMHLDLNSGIAIDGAESHAMHLAFVRPAERGPAGLAEEQAPSRRRRIVG